MATPMTAFLALKPEWMPGQYATLGELEGVDDNVLYALRRDPGAKLELGTRARFSRSKKAYQFGPSGKKTPAGKQPVDLFDCGQPGCLVASPRLAAALTAADGSLQSARVKLVDVDGMDHAFVITAPFVDALDLRASGAKLMKARGLPDELERAKKLVIDAARVPRARSVFRVPLIDSMWFIRASVKDDLAGFVGLAFEDPAKTSFGG
jgi:hypothetical protein